MQKHSTSKKPKGDAPSRLLVEVSPHRTTGGAHIEDLTCRGALNFDQSCALNNDQGT